MKTILWRWDYGFGNGMLYCGFCSRHLERALEYLAVIITTCITDRFNNIARLSWLVKFIYD